MKLKPEEALTPYEEAQTLYNEDYFERGEEAGVSLYTNYRWLPELTLPMAHHIITQLGIRYGDRVMDFGCAKGYLVKALCMLGIKAAGCDVSKYAIDHADEFAKDKCFVLPMVDLINIWLCEADWVISKDVLEHLTEHDVDKFLDHSKSVPKAFHVIPLGDDNGYWVPEYDKDKTHILSKPPDWWITKFESNGWTLKSFSYQMKGIKEKWTCRYPRGNGFFVLE